MTRHNVSFLPKTLWRVFVQIYSECVFSDFLGEASFVVSNWKILHFSPKNYDGGAEARYSNVCHSSFPKKILNFRCIFGQLFMQINFERQALRIPFNTLDHLEHFECSILMNLTSKLFKMISALN